MQIVIDIPEGDYNAVKEFITEDEGRVDYMTVFRAIANGTPLPKRHGDLIDKSNLLTITDYDGENEKTYVLYEEIENAQPIIKAR